MMTMTDAELKFLRDEILSVMVSSIAKAKAEAIAEADARILALHHAIAMTGAASNMGAVEIGCAIVLALAEHSAIDPGHAVAWAEWMASNQPAETDKAVTEGAASTLRIFAKVLGAMVEQRPAGPSSRN